jgi:hypothetical protein
MASLSGQAAPPQPENTELVAALLDGDAAAIEAALGRARLLVCAEKLPGGAAVLRRGFAGGARRVLWAFTDAEAVAAWDRHPAPACAMLEAAALRRASVIAEADVVLNAAGPGTHVICSSPPADDGSALAPPTAAPTAVRSPGNDAGSPVHLGSPLHLELADPAARAPLRAIAREAHERARAAVAAGDAVRARTQLERAIGACARLGDHLHGAAATLELARQTDELAPALARWEQAADTLASLGEADLAIEALLDAAEVAGRAERAEEAERLSVRALALAAGERVCARLIGVWGGLVAR